MILEAKAADDIAPGTRWEGCFYWLELYPECGAPAKDDFGMVKFNALLNSLKSCHTQMEIEPSTGNYQPLLRFSYCS
jgi:rubredoxin